LHLHYPHQQRTILALKHGSTSSTLGENFSVKAVGFFSPTIQTPVHESITLGNNGLFSQKGQT
ncbi:hypothetical protein MUP00_02200, partial [Candidatus Bathyarchaeota archaeon]|nr:hypothetical protein [Candidatus Bathyarchaeota archaeon]